MRKLELFFMAFTLLLITHLPSIAQSARPALLKLDLVAQLPNELPQRVTGLAYDGQKLWATVYLGQGSYATLDPSTFAWELNNNAFANLVMVT